MGHFIGKEIDRIDLGEGFWADIKRRMTYGMQQRLTTHYLKLSANQTADIDLASGNLIALELNIVAWNLVDDKGQAVPLSREAIDSLDPDIADRIINEISRRNQSPKKA